MKSRTFGLVSAGGVMGLLAGAALFGGYAFLWNIGHSKVKRMSSAVASGILGIICGVIIFVGMHAYLRGTEYQPMAWSIGLAYLMVSCLVGIIFGLSLDIRRQRPPANAHYLFMHTLKAVAVSLGVMGAFVIALNLFKQNIFDDIYLQHYRLMDSIGDALRFALWCVSMLSLQSWIKWQHRL